MKKIILYIFSVAIAVTSCDYVSQPLEVQTTTTGTDSTVARKILVEDYTGHECGNCPAAAKVINNTLIPAYGEKIVALAIHAGYFAEIASAPFDGDFSTDAGDSYDSPTYFNISEGGGNPAGMISRIHFNATSLSHVKAHSSWATYVDSLSRLPASVGIRITCTYDSITRLAGINLESKFFSDLSGNYNLVVLLTQDSIIAAQKDYSIPSPYIVSNYVHRHVLRDAINGTWGATIISGNAAEGQIVNKFYAYTVPSTIKNIPCDDAHCHIVAFLYNTATYEVIQAEEKRIIP
jgi:hypothetical protein